MGRERVMYPNHPEQWTWDGYKQEFPICKQDSFSERKAKQSKYENKWGKKCRKQKLSINYNE